MTSDGIVIEEGVIPGALSPLLPLVMAIGSAVLGRRTKTGVRVFLRRRIEELKSLAKGSYAGSSNSTMTFLVMAHDDGMGKLIFDGKGLRVVWPDVIKKRNFQTINERLLKASKAIGSVYVQNPMLRKMISQNLITVHPLGGCVMGETREHGVVNHKSQVFDGSADSKSGATYKGLYVCDGSIMPSPLGVNSLLTISALTERAMIYLADDWGWSFTDEMNSGTERRNSIRPTGICT